MITKQDWFPASLGYYESGIDRIIAAIDYRRQAMIQTERNTLTFILLALIKAELA